MYSHKGPVLCLDWSKVSLLALCTQAQLLSDYQTTTGWHQDR